MASASLEKDKPLLQLQEVDSSRVGSRVLSPILCSSSPGLSIEPSQPICIPSPYTELGHDYTALPFYSPTIFSYTNTGISDCSSVHQSLSPSLFWPSHGHVGSPLPLHRSPARPQHSQPVQSPWVEIPPRDSFLMTRYFHTANAPLVALHMSLNTVLDVKARGDVPKRAMKV